MLPKNLIDLSEKYTFSEIVEYLREQLSRDAFGSLNMFYRTYMMTFIFLSEIWYRILGDAELDIKYWNIYVDLYQPGAVKRKPTAEEAEILEKWGKHKFMLNLDVEDWFIHSYILMDKFTRFIKRLFYSISQKPEERKLVNRIPTKNFDKHRKFFIDDSKKHLITDHKYAKIIRNNTTWYIKELKNIRDDLIQHPNVPKFWGYDVTPDRVRLMRFRHHPKLLEIMHSLRDKYESVYPEIKDEINFYPLLLFFEKQINDLEESDTKKITEVRKSFGAHFPDIPNLFKKMSKFFSLVNDHFILEIQKRFQ